MNLLARTRVVVAALGLVLGAGILGAVLVAADDTSEPSRPPDAHEPPVTDGRRFGRISAAYVGPPELVFDPMEFLVGDEAERAARADGVPEDDIRDFYIRNPEEGTVSLGVASDVVVTRVDCSGGGCVEGRAGDYDAFTLSFDPERRGDDGYRGADGWYWLTIKDGIVVSIDEQYVP